MRTIRSLFFGGLAMLAAVMFMQMPARALDTEPAIYGMSMEWPDITPLDFAVTDVALVRMDDEPKPDGDTHAVTFISQNQPLTSWRFAADAYSRIDPHIVIG